MRPSPLCSERAHFAPVPSNSRVARRAGRAAAGAVAGLGIFGAFTIFDFNRLRRASADSAIAIAASIFLDIFNVFLLLLELFGGSRE